MEGKERCPVGVNVSLITINLAGLIGLMLLTWWVKPQLMRIYNDLGETLPYITRIVLSYGYIAPVALALILAGKEVILKKQSKININLSAGLLITLIIFAYSVAFILPLLHAMNMILPIPRLAP